VEPVQTEMQTQHPVQTIWVVVAAQEHLVRLFGPEDAEATE